MAQDKLLSEATSTYLALIVCSFVIGYWFSIGRNLGYTRRSSRNHDAGQESDLDDPLGLRWSSSSGYDSDSLDGCSPTTSKRSGTEESKLVLVVRSDLAMSKGKIAAQCSHATLACYKALQRVNPALLRHWERSGQAKIALKLEAAECEGQEDEMLLLKAKARSLGLCAQDIRDAGRTQVAAGSRTVLGIGPGPVELINQVTRHLKLL